MSWKRYDVGAPARLRVSREFTLTPTSGASHINGRRMFSSVTGEILALTSIALG